MNRENYLMILETMIEELQRKNKTIPIIVEGERDESSLKQLGFKGEILRLNVGLALFNFCEKLIGTPEVFILTDFDRKGKELRDKLKLALTANGIKANDSYWLGLKHLCSREIKEIEHLHAYIMKLRNEVK